MEPGFSTHVATQAWRVEASRWALARLDEAGFETPGEFEQTRIRPWSTQAKIETTAGTVWFKANHPSMSFEPALHSLWAEIAPDAVDAPIAVDTERGWLLTRDRGRTIADRISDQSAAGRDREGVWCQIVGRAADLQRRAIEHRVAMLATGLPDCSPARVLDHFDHLVDIVDPVDAEFARRLRERRDDVAAACAVLDASPIPVTWQHGDLHPNNVFDTADGPRIFDFGDSQWSPALEILAVPHAVLHEDDDVRWDAVVEAWLASWDVSRRDFDEAWNAVAFVHPVNRALVWHRALVGASEADLTEWGDPVVDHLGRILDA